MEEMELVREKMLLKFCDEKEWEGSQVGVVVISRASHLYDPGSSPHVG